MEKVLSELSTTEINELHLSLIRKASIPFLTTLYKEIGQLLSFDIVSQLPPELSEDIFSYFDENSLCAAAQCSKQWRIIANNDKIWYTLCCKRNYTKYEYLQPSPNWNKGGHPTSPHHKMYDITSIPNVLVPVMCRWKYVFMKGRVLEGNWRRGMYWVAPILRGHREPITGLCTLDNSFVSSSRDGTVCIWNTESLQMVKKLEKHTDEINCLNTANDYIITGCADGAVRIFSHVSGQLLWLLNEGGGDIEEMTCNEQYIVSSTDSFSLNIWKFDSSNKPVYVHTLQGHTSSITCLTLYDSILASGSWDTSIRIWDCNGGVCNHVIAAHEEGMVDGSCLVRAKDERVNCVCFNEIGNIISGGSDGVVRLWNTVSGNNMLDMKGHTQEITCVKCKDEVIVSSSADSTIRIWNYKGVCYFRLLSHIGLVRCLCLADGNRLISGGDRKRICIWDVKTGKLLHEVHRQQTLLHLMCANDLMIITGAPDSGTLCVIKYW